MSDTFPEMLGTKGKQPAEVVPAGRWGVDFANDCDVGETIASATVTVTAPTGDATPLVAGAAVLNGTKVSATFTGGASGNTYSVQMLATGTSGAVYDADFRVRVQEV